MAHDHKIYDSDHHYKISPITRAITNSSPSAKLILMQHDHNSERFSFDIPREIEGHDISECNKIEVHYTNTDATKRNSNVGVYEVTDIAPNEDYPSVLTFSWLVSENATTYAGTLSFLITFACVENGVCTYRWNTGINNSITIAKGMNNGEAIVEQYPDVLSQMKDQLLAAVYGFKEFAYGPTPPETYPYLWFNTAEDVKGRGVGKIILKNADGNAYEIYPMTKLDSIEGFDEELTERLRGHSHSLTSLGAAAAEHKHAEKDVTGLTEALASKAPNKHGHAQTEITGLVEALNNTAPKTHGHAQTEIIDLVTDLAKKSGLNKSLTVPLPYADWGSDGFQTVQVDGVTEDSLVFVDYIRGEDYDTEKPLSLAWSSISAFDLGTGTITAKCYADVPMVDLTMKVIILG